MHICSRVESKIVPGHDALDAIEAILPAGTLSGAPKIRACEIIEELEAEPRGIYGGALGYIDLPEIWTPVLPFAWRLKKEIQCISRQGRHCCRQCGGDGV